MTASTNRYKLQVSYFLIIFYTYPWWYTGKKNPKGHTGKKKIPRDIQVKKILREIKVKKIPRDITQVKKPCFYSFRMFFFETKQDSWTSFCKKWCISNFIAIFWYLKTLFFLKIFLFLILAHIDSSMQTMIWFFKTMTWLHQTMTWFYKTMTKIYGTMTRFNQIITWLYWVQFLLSLALSPFPVIVCLAQSKKSCISLAYKFARLFV